MYSAFSSNVESFSLSCSSLRYICSHVHAHSLVSVAVLGRLQHVLVEGDETRLLSRRHRARLSHRAHDPTGARKRAARRSGRNWKTVADDVR